MMKSKKKKGRVSFAEEDNEEVSSNSKDIEIKYNETSNNGSIIENKSIPDELLSQILCSIDHKTLLNCQLVCKHWHYIIRNYIWHKKAELTLGKTLPVHKNIPWTVYYFICDNRPFYKNLIKNHSGKDGIYKHWVFVENGAWETECPPKNVKSLPNDPVFEDQYYCFVTSFTRCYKEQVINLVSEGFSEYVLDFLQPTVKVSEWFCCRPMIPSKYECTIKLFRDQKSDRTPIETLSYCKIIEGEQMNQWFKFSHEFKNYGKGLRKIVFSHGGNDRHCMAGFCGTKMAGACVTLEIRT